MSLPLEGFKVLDLTRYLSGPYCTMVLADMGAEVLKVERFPEGDDARRLGPMVNGEGYPFATANRNKKSLAVDLKSERGQELFLELCKGADLVIENFRPGVTDKLGINYKSVEKVSPSILYCSITGFGQTGPYRNRPGFDIIAQGVTGFMRMTGPPSGEPAKVGIAVNDIAAGATAIYAILGAELHRRRTGEGQYIDISLVDAGLAWTIWEAAAFFGSGELPLPTGTRHRRTTPYQSYRSQDGYVTIGANNPKLWERLCTQVLERPEWLSDPRFETLVARLENIDELEAEITAITETAPTASWIAKLDAAGVPGGPVLRYDETLENDQVLAREMVVTVEHPRIGQMKTLGVAAKYSKTPLSVRTAAPWLGQHSEETLRALGYDDKAIAELFAGEVVYDRYRQETQKQEGVGR